MSHAEKRNITASKHMLRTWQSQPSCIQTDKTVTLKKIKQNSKQTAKDNRLFINNEEKNWVCVVYLNATLVCKSTEHYIFQLLSICEI